MTAPVQDSLFPLVGSEPPCNHGANYGHMDGTRHCLVCPSTSADMLPIPAPRVVVDETNALAHDWTPWSVSDRAVVLRAIAQTAAECSGLVHATDVRKRLARDVNPRMPGAVICELVRSHVLEDTGRVRVIGEGTTRNRTKRLPVRRLVGALPAA